MFLKASRKNEGASICRKTDYFESLSGNRPEFLSIWKEAGMLSV